MKKRLETFVIVNPTAGGGRFLKDLERIFENLRDKGLSLQIEKTKGPGDAIRLAQKGFKEGFRDFISAGGDGTSFEILNGLIPLSLSTSEKPCLGFIPIGTGNSFLKDFSKDFSDQEFENSLKALEERKSQPCDVLKLTHQKGDLYFINLFSLGFVANVAKKRNQSFSKIGGWGYVLSVLVHLAQLKPETIPNARDGYSFDRDPLLFLSINNSRFTGGKMMMAPFANPCDGKMDIVRVGPMSRWELLKTFPKIFTGKHLGHPSVQTHQASTLKFEVTKERDVMIDGESLSLLPQKIEVLPKALHIRV